MSKRFIGTARQPGQSLVEIVVGLALLATVILAVTQLSNQSSRINGEAGRRSQALALATREYEALRLYRDSHLKAGDSWDNTMPPLTTGCTHFVMENDNANPPTWTYRANLTQEAGESTLHQSYVAHDELYGGLFKRLITMCIGREFTPGNPGTYANSADVRTIEVSVIWDEPEGPQRAATLNGIISKW